MTELVRGRYEVLDIVGQGGQAEVFRAIDLQHDRQVAIKVRRVATSQERDALLREARVLLGLRPHANLPLVREDFFEGDRYYIVMDWVAGESIATVLDRHRSGLPIAEVVRDLRPVAGALDHLHGHDPPIIHKDVKPGNLIREPDGRVVLVDFGLSNAGPAGTKAYSGTPGFMAPELATAAPPTPAADVFELAATAFAMLTGHPPDGTMPMLDGLPPGRNEAVQSVVRQGLSIDPDRRQIGATEFVDRLAWASGLERRPSRIARRTAGVAVLVGAVIVVLSMALLSSGVRGPTITTASVPADALGVLDPTAMKVSSALSLGGRPGAVAYGEGALWVVDASTAKVLRVDSSTREVVARIAVGSDPSGIAVGGGSVWVTNADDRSVSRIDPLTTAVRQLIVVGNDPTGIAADTTDVWVTNTQDDTVSRLDSATGAVKATIPVGDAPVAIAIGFGSVWVANESAGTVSRISPSNDQLIDTIRIGRDPKAVASGPTAVWVTGRGDGTVWRIDPSSDAITASEPVHDPTMVLANDAAVWVVDEAGGRLIRIDGATGRTTAIVALGTPPHALALGDGSLFVTTRSPIAEHRGGTLVVVSNKELVSIDPALAFEDASGGRDLSALALRLTNDTLVTYRRVGGTAGTTLVADLAVRIPGATDAGLTYTFQLRPGIRFSDGTSVAPADVRRTFERAYAAENESVKALGPPIIGIDRCTPDVCDLSRGIETDDAAGTATFRLAAPDPLFLYRLTFPAFSIVPATTPPRAISEPIPATGPYVIERFDLANAEIVLRRNPTFAEWSSDARPDGFADVIDIRGGRDPGSSVNAVERGEVDFLDPGSPDADTDASGRLGEQAHPFIGLVKGYAFLNTTVPPFDDRRVRQAINFAVDRRELGAAVGGPGFSLTCQTLPPGLPAYEPYCPYTLDPGSGVWTAPDPVAAQRLVEASGTRGMDVVVWTSSFDGGANEAGGQVLVRTLSDLGYRATLKVGPQYLSGEYGAVVGDPSTLAQLGLSRWGADFPVPEAFIGPLLTCEGIKERSNDAQLCDPGIEALVQHATDLERSDPAAANAAWTAVDRAVVDDAAWVAYGDLRGVDLVSARVGNYQRRPIDGVLLDQLWVH
jgi:peptide/nickel transport system substrate-binding protein